MLAVGEEASEFCFHGVLQYTALDSTFNVGWKVCWCNFVGGLLGLFDFGTRKKYPPKCLNLSFSDRYDSSLYKYRIMSLRLNSTPDYG